MSSSKNIIAVVASALLVNAGGAFCEDAKPYKYPEFTDREIELTIQSRDKRLQQAAAAQATVTTDSKTLLKQRDDALRHVAAIQLSERALKTELTVVKDDARELDKWSQEQWQRAEDAEKALKKMTESRDYWRKCALGLGTLVVGFLMWKLIRLGMHFSRPL